MALELLKLYYLGQPFVVAAGLAVLVALVGGAVISRPVVPLVVYLAVFFVFAQTNYGSLDVFMSNPVYARGSGQLFYPALCWGLLVTVFWAWLGRRFSQAPAPAPSPVRNVLWLWLCLLLVHLVAGLALGVRAADVLDSNGFAQMAWMLPLVHLMHVAGHVPAGPQRVDVLEGLGRLLVLAALAKAVFGLGRLVVAGGDPSNVYQNFGHLDVRLTYFDLCDSLVCLLGAAAAAAMLAVAPQASHGKAWRAVCVLTVVLAVACIVLSHRRTAWGGLALAAVWLMWHVDRRWRWPVWLSTLPLLAAALVYVASQRLTVQAGNTALWALFFDLKGSVYGPESTRLLELKLAWASFLDSPVVGLGSWGRFANAHLIPWQLMTGGSFVHSGVLHLLMKAGVVGLLLLLALGWAYRVEWRRAWQAGTASGRTLSCVSAAGVLFLLPDFLFGTPVPQLRTMQLVALCLGLPGLVLAAQRARLPLPGPAADRVAGPARPRAVQGRRRGAQAVGT